MMVQTMADANADRHWRLQTWCYRVLPSYLVIQLQPYRLVVRLVNSRPHSLPNEHPLHPLLPNAVLAHHLTRSSTPEPDVQQIFWSVRVPNVDHDCD